MENNIKAMGLRDWESYSGSEEDYRKIQLLVFFMCLILYMLLYKRKWSKMVTHSTLSKIHRTIASECVTSFPCSYSYKGSCNLLH